jgi:uncharacterized protein (DUF952 family)
MASIVGSVSRVVDTPSFHIDELVGNVSTRTDAVSLALVVARAGTSEPWLTLGYDEWISVTKGAMVVTEAGKPPLAVGAGQTCHIPCGTRFQPTFPADTEYIPVCVPAFRPDRCEREDTTEEGEGIAANLAELHAAEQPREREAPPEKLYHMCPRADWDAAAESGGAYWPRTFEADQLTHATGVPSRLLSTANHYYKASAGDWICVAFGRAALRERGIFVRDEHATPVGGTATDPGMKDWVCPHVIGGIPVEVVTEISEMRRGEGGEFLSIEKPVPV